MAVDISQFEAFHGTTIDNQQSIEQIGLIGLIGKFVENAYDEEIEALMDYFRVDSIQDLENVLEERAVIFLGSGTPEGLNRSINAIFAQIAFKLDKSMHDVTPTDVAQHGLLLAFDDAEYLYLFEEDGRVYQLKEPEYEELDEDLFLDKYELEEIPMERPLGAEPGDLFYPETLKPDAYIVGDDLVQIIRNSGYSIVERNW